MLKSKEYSLLIRRISKTGRDVWLQAVYSPVMDEMGRVLKVIKIATDATAEVAAQAMLCNTVTQNSDNARMTDGMASKTTKDAVNGGSAVRQTVKAMKQIACWPAPERRGQSERASAPLLAAPSRAGGSFRPY